MSAPGPDTRPSLLDLPPEGLAEIVGELGEPGYRAAQVGRGVYRRFATDFEEMTDLPRALRSRLAKRLRVGAAAVDGEQTSADGSTTKLLLRMDDGELIETVLMRYDPFGQRRARRTVCVSTQAGCAMGCTFCATGAQGFRRQLSAGEILSQVLTMARVAAREGDGAGLTNVVFMGMGEPLASYAATHAALSRLTAADGFGMSPRRVTVSTVGLPAGMRRLAADHPQVNLAVSLHAADEALRRDLVPVPSASLGAIVEAARAHVAATGRRVSGEYVLLAGVNDSAAQAGQLGRLLRGLNCHVNLIPINPSPGVLGERPSRSAVLRFQARLTAAGVPATVRVEKGRDIAAACGQLRGDRVKASG
ncbi:MAG: 23S rRNA (adenine(2503)-C(2))-methyltransferase RlmN [Chloroflexi bacterium]|nr:23S rRNA (adenine(2503)-C(2))-methyltransferase RlmN [Chloroflexota bacterium]